MIRRAHNETFFSSVTIESCYWAGFLAADGCVSWFRNSTVLALAVKDRIHVEAFKTVIGYTGEIYDNLRTASCGVRLYSCNQWHYDLENTFNVVPNKSLSLKPPHELMHHGVEYELAFLVGYIDGDGCIRYDKRDGILQLDVFGGSERFIKWAKALLESTYSLPDKKIFVSKNERGFLYRLLGKNAVLVRNALANTCKFQMNRKWNPVMPVRAPRDRRMSRESFSAETS